MYSSKSVVTASCLVIPEATVETLGIYSMGSHEQIARTFRQKEGMPGMTDLNPSDYGEGHVKILHTSNGIYSCQDDRNSWLHWAEIPEPAQQNKIEREVELDLAVLSVKLVSKISGERALRPGPWLERL